MRKAMVALRESALNCRPLLAVAFLSLLAGPLVGQDPALYPGTCRTTE